MLNPGCSAYQEQDEYVCNRCHYRWAIKDPDPPECKADEQLQDEINRRGIAGIREMLSE